MLGLGRGRELHFTNLVYHFRVRFISFARKLLAFNNSLSMVLQYFFRTSYWIN
jgi:hypothetical protein